MTGGTGFLGKGEYSLRNEKKLIRIWSEEQEELFTKTISEAEDVQNTKQNIESTSCVNL